MIESILTSLGLTHGSVVGGFLGSLVSLKFIEEQTRAQRVTSVCAGAAAAAYIGPMLARAFGMEASMQGGISFLAGVLFMSMVGAVIKAMPEIVAALRKKYIGGE